MTRPRPAQPRRWRGFTLIEMVVVVALVGILASAAVPLQALNNRRSQEVALREALRTLRSALDAHADAVRGKRIAPGPGGTPWPKDLVTLVNGVPLVDEQGQPAASGQRLYLLRRLPRDPFADTLLPAADTWALRHSQSEPGAFEAGGDVFDVRSRSAQRALDGSAYADW